MKTTLKSRGKMFNKLSIEDWHTIIEFEDVVRSYLKMNRYEDTITDIE